MILSSAGCAETQRSQPARDLYTQQPQWETDSEIGKGAGSVRTGRVTGEVVGIDKKTGLIEVRTEEGTINRLSVEGDARKQLRRVKKGDRVDLVMALRAVEILPREAERAQPTLP